MHELSIAQSIVELAEQQARNRNAQSIEQIEMEIGSLAGIELNALKFVLKSAMKGSMLAEARIEWRIIAGEGRCGDCEAVFPVKNLLSTCTVCGSFAVKITKGKELRIKSITIN